MLSALASPVPPALSDAGAREGPAAERHAVLWQSASVVTNAFPDAGSDSRPCNCLNTWARVIDPRYGMHTARSGPARCTE